MNMQTIQKQLLLSLLVGSSCITSYGSSILFFEEMIHEMDHFHEQMEKHFSQVRQEMKEQCSYLSSRTKDSPTLTMHQTDEHVEINCSSIALKDSNLEANWDQDTSELVIKAEGNKVSIQAVPRTARYTYLNVECQQRITKENDHKDGASQSRISNYAHIAQNFAGQLDLEHAHIEYEAESQNLKVTIPIQKKLLTKIPVTIKERSEK